MEAEQARARLAMKEIPAHLDNATLVLWCWQYSNATGGVGVLVRDLHAKRARLVLASQPTPAQWQPPPWCCAKCQAQIDGMWRFCWSCGTASDGTEDPEFFSASEPKHSATAPPNHGLVVLLNALVLMVLIVSLGLLPGIAIAFLVVVARWLFDHYTGSPDDAIAFHGIPDQCGDVLIETAETSPDRSSDETIVMIQRAWRAAVFAFQFAPFAFYSLWLLCRFPLKTTPMGPCERLRYRAAWIFTILGLPVGLFYMLALIGAFLLAAYDVLASLFNTIDNVFAGAM